MQARVLGRSSIAEWAGTRMLQGHGSRLESELGLLTLACWVGRSRRQVCHRIPECLPAETSSAQHESSKQHASAVCHWRERLGPYHLPGRNISVLREAPAGLPATWTRRWPTEPEIPGLSPGQIIDSRVGKHTDAPRTRLPARVRGRASDF